MGIEHLKVNGQSSEDPKQPLNETGWSMLHNGELLTYSSKEADQLRAKDRARNKAEDLVRDLFNERFSGLRSYNPEYARRVLTTGILNGLRVIRKHADQKRGVVESDFPIAENKFQETAARVRAMREAASVLGLDISADITARAKEEIEYERKGKLAELHSEFRGGKEKQPEKAKTPERLAAEELIHEFIAADIRDWEQEWEKDMSGKNQFPDYKELARLEYLQTWPNDTAILEYAKKRLLPVISDAREKMIELRDKKRSTAEETLFRHYLEILRSSREAARALGIEEERK